jgi:hypothetical protein
VERSTGLQCASITGPGSTGLTKPGQQQLYLDEITVRAKMAAKFGGAQPVVAGLTQTGPMGNATRQANRCNCAVA